jgi:hypothetical protein
MTGSKDSSNVPAVGFLGMMGLKDSSKVLAYCGLCCAVVMC